MRVELDAFERICSMFCLVIMLMLMLMSNAVWLICLHSERTCRLSVSTSI